MLILLAGIGTSGVDEDAILPERRPAVGENALLSLTAQLDIGGAPFGDGFGVPPEEAAATTGCVDDNAIEIILQACEVARIVTGDDGIRRAPFDDIFPQHIDTVADRFVTHQQAFRR